MKEKFRLTPLEKSWIGYDIANSAFILLVSTIIPIYFEALCTEGGLSNADYLSTWMKEANLNPACQSAEEYQLFIDRKTELLNSLKDYLLAGE